jgi:hypothetical protein
MTASTGHQAQKLTLLDLKSSWAASAAKAKSSTHSLFKSPWVTLATGGSVQLCAITQIDGPIVTFRDGQNQLHIRRSVAKQQLSALSWVNVRFRE